MAGFNGAMPFQAWIFLRIGRLATEAGRFNGAMPFQAWICGGMAVVKTVMMVLQWGHALSGMDISHRMRWRR